MAASMRRPPRPLVAAAAASSSSSSSNNPFAAVLLNDDDEKEKEFVLETTQRRAMSIVGATTNTAAAVGVVVVPVVVRETDDDHDKEACRSDNDDDDDDDASCCSNNNAATAAGRRRAKPPRPSMAAVHHPRTTALSASAKRRRRRSSARFLQLAGGGGGGNHHRRRLSSNCHRNNNNNNGGNSSLGGGGGGGGEEDGSNGDDDDDDDDARVGSQNTATHGEGKTLSELYQKAIRMNAENKINAGNSWNLRLIENIDTFLEEHDDDDEEEENTDSEAATMITTQTPMNAGAGAAARSTTTTTNKKKKRVNFTKASCTLDASVKIYSYRVDDVHLTSYKVLANLNRSSNTDKNSKNHRNGGGGEDADGGGDDNDGEPAHKDKRSNKSSGSTLETHIANINLNKLDAAFDIDPLFHKMSKTFDEGGAKGLLLVNLGVGENGCNIIFDSSHANDDCEPEEHRAAVGDKPPRLQEGMMDVTSLTAKLESLLSEQQCGEPGSSSIYALPLVPQLTALRAEHEALESGGFLEHGAALAATVGPKTPGGKHRRYHADAVEERQADYSIHKEALERSGRRNNLSLSMMRLLQDDDDSPDNNGGPDKRSATNMDDDDDDDDGYADNFGGGYDDGDDNNNDDGFDTFIAAVGGRYSDISFSSPGGGGLMTVAAAATTTTATPLDASTTTATTTASLIDAIASGATVLSGSDYEYFSKASRTANNLWAGAAHWKRAATSKKDAVAAGKTKKGAAHTTPKKGTKKKERVLVPLHAAPDLSHLFASKAIGSGNSSKRRVLSPTTQLSKAMVTKHTNQENLLPQDAGFQGVEQLTKLFLRPNAVVKQQQQQLHTCAVATTTEVLGAVGQVAGKTVGFNLPDWDEGSYGGGDADDDGPGFDFGGGEDHSDDDDEFLVRELEGVRKVEKVRVGYAVVAKKVDVKRLKRDLWNELESKFGSSTTDDDEMKSVESKTDDEEEKNDTEKVVSFQDTVHELELQKSQIDVTLPFYFICILHLANEKCLRLESEGLNDFTIHQGSANATSQLF